jgi:spore coat protein U-like protein
MQLRALVALALCGATGTSLAAGACSVSSTGLAFLAYQSVTFAGKLTSADKDSTATVSVVCTGIAVGGGYTIALGAGHYGPGDRIASRYLNNATPGGGFMQYNVYRDAARTMVWGTSPGTMLGGTIPVGSSNQSQTVYGRIPAGQTSLKAGSFSDSLVMTISYEP